MVDDDARGLLDCCSPCGGNTGLSSTGVVLLRLVVGDRGQFADAVLVMEAPLVEFGLLLFPGSLVFSPLRHFALRF